MRRGYWLVGVTVVAAALLSFGCGANNSAVSSESGTQQPGQLAANVQVQITPVVAGVLVGQTQQFSATVTGTSNTAVKWSVNGVAGGNGSLGQISSTGLYTAPPQGARFCADDYGDVTGEQRNNRDRRSGRYGSRRREFDK